MGENIASKRTWRHRPDLRTPNNNVPLYDGNDTVLGARVLLLEFSGEPCDIIGKIVHHAGWEANGSLVAEIQEVQADEFIRRGVHGAALAILRVPYFVGNRLMYAPRRPIDFPDLDDAQNGQVRGKSGEGLSTPTPGLDPTVYAID